jgi:hypothetical protein
MSNRHASSAACGISICAADRAQKLIGSHVKLQRHQLHRPLPLAPTFLVLTSSFLVPYEAGIITLVVLSREGLQRLHFRNNQHGCIIQYSEMIVGLVAKIWFKIIANTYLHLLRQVAVASVPVPSNEKTNQFTFQTMCGINLILIADWKLPDCFKYG